MSPLFPNLSGTFAPLTGPFTPTTTGAVTATRFVGGTATVAPTTGTFSAGDYVISQNGKIWICTAGGTPGTWIEGDSTDYAPIAGPFAPSMTGAVAATRYVGGTADVAPTTGTFAIGDFVVSQTAKVWICTVAGTPGTWVEAAVDLTSAQTVGGVKTFSSAPVVPSSSFPESAVTNLTTDLAAKAALAGPFAPSITGATSATRYVGGTATVAPTTGTFAVGDFVISQNGKTWICTGAGTPGTWIEASSADYAAIAGPFAPSITGAASATRYVGGTATVAPTTGTFAIGDLVVSQNGKLWICTVAGTPGTWIEADSTAYAAIAGPFAPSITGATSATRYIGGTVAGSPTTGTFAVGDFVVSQNGRVWVCTSAGTPGTWIQANQPDPFRRTGAIAESVPRAAGNTNASLLSTGRISIVGIQLPINTVVTTITFTSATTPLSVGSNQWFGLFDLNRAKLAVTSDDTSTAWAANTEKTLTLSAPYTTLYTGIFYLGVLVVATVVPSLAGPVTTNSTLPSSAPAVAGNCDSSLTNPASCPSTLASPSAIAGIPWAYCS